MPGRYSHALMSWRGSSGRCVPSRIARHRPGRYWRRPRSPRADRRKRKARALGATTTFEAARGRKDQLVSRAYPGAAEPRDGAIQDIVGELGLARAPWQALVRRDADRLAGPEQRVVVPLAAGRRRSRSPFPRLRCAWFGDAASAGARSPRRPHVERGAVAHTVFDTKAPGRLRRRGGLAAARWLMARGWRPGWRAAGPPAGGRCGRSPPGSARDPLPPAADWPPA